MKRKTLPGGKDPKSEMYNLIEIVVRSVLSEKQYQTKSKVENLISKHMVDVKFCLENLEARVSTLEASVVSVKCQANDIQNNLFEKSLQLSQEISTVEKDLKLGVEKLKDSTTEFLQHLQCKHVESVDSAHRAITEVKEETRKSSFMLADDIRFNNRELAHIRDCVDTLWSMRPGTPQEIMLNGPFSVNSASVIDLLDKRMDELEMKVSNGKSGHSNLSIRSSNAGRNYPRHSDLDGSMTEDFRIEIGSYQGKNIGGHVMRLENLEEKLNCIVKHISDKDVPKRKIKELRHELHETKESSRMAYIKLQDYIKNFSKWADHVQSCIGVLSRKIGIPNNLCVKLDIDI